jgi:hypothetical protein
VIRLPKEQEDRIIAVYQEGHSRDDTARIVGCSPATVTNVFRRRGLEMRSRGGPRYKVTHREYDATRALYEAGYSEAEVGTILGLSRGAISWRLHFAGVPRRDRVESMFLRRKERPDPGLLLTPYEGVNLVERPAPPQKPGIKPRARQVSGPPDQGGLAAGGD